LRSRRSDGAKMTTISSIAPAVSHGPNWLGSPAITTTEPMRRRLAAMTIVNANGLGYRFTPKAYAAPAIGCPIVGGL
jgi:hypothetical protein